ncbi:MAG: ATP-dependent sacrificial sulfur transferase LarE [Spirochaetales bacterium]|nr:ATP-dependent sacrificial sulfur transferase LarE [Spirochaetales bacterium]
MMKEVKVFENVDDLSKGCAEFIFNEIKNNLQTKNIVNIVLSGGTTPIESYKYMAHLLKDKPEIVSKINWFIGDERWVPSVDKESNNRLVHQFLLDPINAPEGNLYSWHACEKDHYKCADDYDKLIQNHFHYDGGADILLLGMGDDGHTASLFPGGKTLLQEGEFGSLSPDISLSAIAVYVNKTNTWRLTLTPQFINKAKLIIFLISGAKKRESYNKVLKGDTSLPASWISGRNVFYFITKDLLPKENIRENKTTLKKLSELKSILKKCKKVIIAFSGGVDSSFLLYMAYTVLGKENVLAVTANSETYPGKEMKDAVFFTEKYGITHKIISTCEISEINEKGNPPNRCYYCKKELFNELKKIAREEHYNQVIEGSNKDDERDFRPGSKAIQELNIRSPLKEAQLTKDEIRSLSKDMDLPFWNKPAFACLTSRFPYHTEINKDILKKIEKAEEYLNSLGFTQCRVRYFGDKVSVEVEEDRVQEAMILKSNIESALNQLGFESVEIDPEGYRTGRMNLLLKNEK